MPFTPIYYFGTNLNDHIEAVMKARLRLSHNSSGDNVTNLFQLNLVLGISAG